MIEYNQTIDQTHAAIRELTAKVEAGVVPQAMLDAFVAGARQREDWTEPIPKVWVVGKESWAAYFLTCDDKLGYAPLTADEKPYWADAGLTEDTEGEFAAEHVECEATLRQAYALLPDFIAAL